MLVPVPANEFNDLLSNSIILQFKKKQEKEEKIHHFSIFNVSTSIKVIYIW